MQGAFLAAVVAALLATSAAITDTDILNFALNLEYLEANFYSLAITGKGLPAKYRGGGPAAVGGYKAELFGDTAKIGAEIMNDEVDHVIFLRSALGPNAVPQPAINLGSAFGTAANAALGTVLKPSFMPYKSNLVFLEGAFIFEDVGVTAYNGAAPLISSKTYLGAAASILAVEAYHAGSIRTQLYQRRNQIEAPYGAKVSAVVNAIIDLRAKLGGGKEGLLVSSSGKSGIVPTDSTSLAYARTPAEVISITTAGSKTGKGLFFPKGLNGNIK